MKTIELHSHGMPVTFNVDHINAVLPNQDSLPGESTSKIYLIGDPTAWIVDEGYQEVLRIIREVDYCQIKL